MTRATILRIQRLRKERRALYTEYAAASGRLEKAEIKRKLDRTSLTLRGLTGSSRFI